MKRCPFCAEEIQDDAIKCKHCMEMIDLPPGLETHKLPWHFRTSTIVLAFLCVGPFALPLLWLHPKLSQEKKVVYSAIALAISLVIFWVLRWSVEQLTEYYSLLNSLMGY